MTDPQAVLLLDDGELDDVQSILEALEVPHQRVRGGAISADLAAPTKLLVTTPRRVDAVRLPARGTLEGDSLVRIVVVNEDSTTLRARLRRIGFDYLVRRPVHPEALRLLMMRAVYSGFERRTDPRVPMDMTVSFRTGVLPRRASMVDLSSSGCRLLSRYPLEPGKRVLVDLPIPGHPERGIALKGSVVRMSLDESLGPGGPYSAAVAFDHVSDEAREALHAFLAGRSNSPIALGSDPTAEAGVGELVPPEARGEDLRRVELDVDVRLGDVAKPARRRAAEPPPPRHGPNRRRTPRSSYDRRIAAFGDRALRVLVARDLSAGGMRIETVPGLELGDRLHLAIYGAAAEEPFFVWATVARDDGERGMGLQFDELAPAAAEQLEKLLADLPAVESLRGDEVDAMGTVVSEILAD